MGNKVFRLATLAILSSIIFSTADAEMRPVMKKRAGTPPFEVLEEIIRTSENRLSGMTEPETMKIRTTPHLVWVTGPDPELQTTTVYGTPGNLVMILRSLGSRLETIRAELDHTILTLHSPVLLISAVTGRTGGAAESNEASAKDRAAAEANIDLQVDWAIERYRQRVENGRLTVIGSIFDAADLYGRGRDRQIVININGEKDRVALRNLPVTTRITVAALGRNFGRD